MVTVPLLLELRQGLGLGLGPGLGPGLGLDWGCIAVNVSLVYVPFGSWVELVLLVLLLHWRCPLCPNEIVSRVQDFCSPTARLSHLTLDSILPLELCYPLMWALQTNSEHVSTWNLMHTPCAKQRTAIPYPVQVGTGFWSMPSTAKKNSFCSSYCSARCMYCICTVYVLKIHFICIVCALYVYSTYAYCMYMSYTCIYCICMYCICMYCMCIYCMCM